ncbi:MAG: hypothetical protein M1839_000308, partial [Geoglossum umbratile]
QVFNPFLQTPSHQEYERSEGVLYNALRILGHGSYGFVEEVEAVSGRAPVQGRFARKTIKMPPSLSRSVKDLIKNEVNIVKRLDHHHIVRIVGTYSERRRFAVIMAPIAEMNLGEYFENKPRSDDEPCWWFGCLSAGLGYLHSQRIKHRDIKPANILVRGEEILYSDFRIARDVWDEATTSTAGTVPEVATQGRRGSLSDVFSLGRVFLEMVTFLMWEYGVSIEGLHNYKETDGKRAYYANLGKTLEWILDLVHRTKTRITTVNDASAAMFNTSTIEFETAWVDTEHGRHPGGWPPVIFALEWCIAMLQPDLRDRIRASLLLGLF